MFLVLANYIISSLYADYGKEFIATIVVDLLKEINPNCFIVTGHPRTPHDQGSVESTNKIIQQVLKSISSENCLRSIEVNWTRCLGQVMAGCNSHSGRQKHSVSSYKAVFSQKYHPQLKCNMSEMRECWSIFQRLKMSPDERLETYVRQHDIVDIEFDHAEYDEDDNVDDSDEDEGVDIDENVFPELNLEEMMCSLLTNTAMTAWEKLVCMMMTGMTTLSMKFLLSTHLPLLWIHLLCTAKLRWTFPHQ
jgi:hypothetical protein